MKPAKVYLGVPLNITVAEIQKQPGTLARTGYLQTEVEPGKD
jgi:hypothetical protein